MSASTSSNGTAAVAARDAYRASVAAGEPLSGAELARQYGRSPSWGRAIAAAERAAMDAERQHERQAVSVENEAAPAADVERQAESPAAPVAAPAVDAAAPARRPWLDTAVTLIVALVAAAASWGHMVHVASLAGEPIWPARAFPVTVDGLAVAALRRGELGRRWLVVALAVSVAANVASSFPELAAQGGRWWLRCRRWPCTGAIACCTATGRRPRASPVVCGPRLRSGARYAFYGGWAAGGRRERTVTSLRGSDRVPVASTAVLLPELQDSARLPCALVPGRYLGSDRRPAPSP